MKLALPLLCSIAACAHGNKNLAGPDSRPWDRGAVYQGMCDASAAVAVDETRFLVADDEDNLIRLYRRGAGGAPDQVIDPAQFMTLDRGSPEADIEAAVRVGDVIYWLSSHGRSSKGQLRLSRLQFFATRVELGAGGDVRLTAVGRPYTWLLEAIVADPRLRGFGLEAAAQLSSKAPGGLNIEGLALAPDGRLLVGFRSPLPEGHALVVPLAHPERLVTGGDPELGDPITIDLGGLGIRSLDAHGGGFLIAAGPAGGERRARLFRWEGAGAPVPVATRDLGDFVPEAMIVGGDGRVELLSDDGSLRIGGKECKKTKPPERRRFRGLSLDLPSGG